MVTRRPLGPSERVGRREGRIPDPERKAWTLSALEHRPGAARRGPASEVELSLGAPRKEECSGDSVVLFWTILGC